MQLAHAYSTNNHYPDLKGGLEAFRGVQQALSEPCFNQGTPLGALALHRACYHWLKGTLNACLAIWEFERSCW